MWLLSALSLLLFTSIAWSRDGVNLGNTLIDEKRGFELREYAFQPPFSPNLHWMINGFAMVTPKRIVLTRDLPSLHGAIWNKNPVPLRDWEVVINFRITNDRKAADGLAFWYTEKTGTGAAYGAPENFTGIGVALDTYSNQGSQYERINILFNRGDKVFDGGDDGKQLVIGRLFSNSTEKTCNIYGSTLNDVNEKPGKTMKLLIRYFEENLSVYYAKYDQDTWTHCGSVEGLWLPVKYHMGVSANTGELHSAHEVVSFKVFELHGKHDSDPFPQPSFYGMKLGTFDYSSFTSGSTYSTKTADFFWVTFKLAFYSALIAGLGFTVLLIYREFVAARRRNKFY